VVPAPFPTSAAWSSTTLETTAARRDVAPSQGRTRNPAPATREAMCSGS
jgi:hypothetical protein